MTLTTAPTTTAPTTTAPTEVRFVHETPLGPMVSVWTDAGLFSLTWDETPVSERHEARAQGLEDRLGEYFQTGNADFDAIQWDPQGWTPFTEAVYRCCREITPGMTVTYKQLAERAGNAAASRAVGAAMSRNRLLLVIPCHRVISAGGGLRGFSAPGGLQTKQFLLDLETA